MGILLLKSVQLPENKKYKSYVKTLGCLICSQDTVDGHHMWHNRKCSYALVPLCRGHHREFHDLEQREFEQLHNIDLHKELILILWKWIHKESGLQFESASTEMRMNQFGF